MGRFATGVAVVTTTADGAPHGMTVNSLTSVSLEPPLLLVCLTTGARSTEAIIHAGRFAVNILPARQEPLALRFARRGEDHFAGLDLTSRPYDRTVRAQRRNRTTNGAKETGSAPSFQKRRVPGTHAPVPAVVTRSRKPERAGTALRYVTGRSRAATLVLWIA